MSKLDHLAVISACVITCLFADNGTGTAACLHRNVRCTVISMIEMVFVIETDMHFE